MNEQNEIKPNAPMFSQDSSDPPCKDGTALFKTYLVNNVKDICLGLKVLNLILPTCLQ